MSAEASAQPPEFFAKLQSGMKLAGCYLLNRRVEGAARPLWIAHDEVLARDIALQFVPPTVLSRSGATDQLRQDVKRARQFVNPRVLRVQDLIEEGEWTAVAMDSFGGRPLAAAMAENTHGFFEVAEVLPLARELCETLDAAHQFRFVHGGLSPAEVLVGGGQAKVMNLGLSAALRSEGAPSLYASAQQLAGASATVADDVFAVGALLHTLLAGAPPFEGSKRDGAPSISEHRRALKHRGGDVPENWERAIASCLSEDPAARPPSCGEILRILESGAPAVSPAAPMPAPVAADVKSDATPPVLALEAPIEQPAKEPAKEPEKAAAAPEPTKAPPIREKPVPAPAPVIPEPAPVEQQPVPEKAAPLAPESQPVAEGLAPVRKTAPPTKERESVPVDHDELAAQVRREEAEDEARQLGGVDDDDAFYERSHGSGPSMLTLVILVAFAAVVAFICYQVFFAKSSRSASSATSSTIATESTTPIPNPAPTPVPTPVVRMAEATPTPAPSTPQPTPIARATPEPMPPAAEQKTAAPAEEPTVIETAIAEMKLAREKTSKDLPAAKKAAEDLDKQQKKLADDLKKAEMAAQEAGKIAADKMKLADEARKAAADAAEQWTAKKSELAKSEEMLVKLEADLKDRERALIEAKMAAETARSARPAPTPKRTAGSTPAPSTPKSEAAPTSDDPRVAFEQKMKELSKALDGGSKSGTPAPVAAKSAMELAKAPTPAPEPANMASASGVMNSLGMRLVPLPDADVLVCIWPTRVRDFEAFAKATGLKSNLWKDPGFKQTPDHPVVNVTWQEAVAFCKWLTTKDQKEGAISTKQSYRLLTDLEWSRGAGLASESGNTPEARDMGVADVYPWGKTWPPPTGAGNYTGEETGSEVAIKGYNDGFPWTSPVGSFPPNKLGLYDMGGNVWQWCMDAWNADSKAKVLRGASWYNGALKLSLLTSCRVHASPDSSTDNYGFRVALTSQDVKGGK